MSNFPRFRIITFDCYGTLINWEPGILRSLRPILTAHGAHLSDAEILRLYGELESEAEAGEYRSYREVLREVVRQFGERLGFRTTPTEQDSLPESMQKWKPFPDTLVALACLKSKLQVGIISNVDDDLFAATARKLKTDFDVVVTAAQARAYKPAKEIFALAEKKIGVPREQWLHAGQSTYHDIIPARALGIATAWVNRPSVRPNIGAARKATSKPDFEVHSLAELAEMA